MSDLVDELVKAAATFDPLRAVAILLHSHDDGEPSFLGTCFAYRQPRYFITAAHCTGTLAPNDLEIFSPFPFVREWQPESVHTHPDADIALLDVGEEGPDVKPFQDHVSDYVFGEEFAAFGYPESIFGPDGREPTPRVFKGHYQRIMVFYESYLGYRYTAGELNIPAPAGLSGGPLFRPTAPGMLTGMVTENLESKTFLEEVEEIQTENRTTETRYQRVVQYGVALMLDGVEGWLNEHAPRLKE